MAALLSMFYGAFCYALFFGSFLYAIGFVIGIGTPTALDHGPASPHLAAWLIDLALLAVFAVQHSGMARRRFKNWLVNWLPRSIERSTYVLASTVVLILLFWQWRALPGTVWSVGNAPGRAVLYALYVCGWLFVLSGSFLINHFDLFGLRQVWLVWRTQPYTPPAYTERGYYRIIRHPLMLGFIIAFWATPDMTVGHLLFAVATTGYVVLALQLEERDLVAFHGDAYRDYQSRVPMLVPWLRPRSSNVRRASGRRA